MRSLLDTNLLVYADSADEPAKQRRAIALIRQHRGTNTAVLSTQVLQEFVNVALRKLRLPPAPIRQRLGFYAGFEMVPVTGELMAGALDLHVLHSLSFYDALILQAAKVSGCKQLLSEDMPNGAIVDGVRIVSPFLAAQAPPAAQASPAAPTPRRPPAAARPPR